MVCRMCRQDRLTTYLDLGFQPPSDEFRRKDQLLEPVVYFPLQVALCEACGLSQLTHVVSKETLYRHDYPYEAST
ncbi:MAG: methyltransferase, partial [Elusimicrobia bacterium]|nr:methyltransferase [Elusimicrobiota bacterium]